MESTVSTGSVLECFYVQYSMLKCFFARRMGDEVMTVKACCEKYTFVSGFLVYFVVQYSCEGLKNDLAPSLAAVCEFELGACL